MRDLWSGSLMLSWLVEKAIAKATEAGGKLVYPDQESVKAFNKGIEAFKDGGSDRPLPMLPNVFTMTVPAGNDAEGVAKAAEKAVIDEVVRLAGLVWSELSTATESPFKTEPTWDRQWNSQINSYFSVRSVLLKDPEGDWFKQMKQSAAAMAANKQVAHYPNSTPSGAGEYAPKCTLMGSFEAMGPAGMQSSRDFWEAVAAWRGVHGVRIRKGERLCAVALVKRFFPAVELGHTRIDDVATVAAKKWLEEADPDGKLGWKEGSYGDRDWSGQWLHGDGQEDDPRPPDSAGRLRPLIKEHGPPPTYYAIVDADGDKIGDWLSGKKLTAFRDHRTGQEFQNDLSTNLGKFTEQAARLATDYNAELIYAGGDDALAILPAAKAVAFVQALREAFRKCMEPGAGAMDADGKPTDKNLATLSAGIAIVHYKEDLRYALSTANAAQKVAKKQAGRDCIGLAVCKRSGDHTTVPLPLGAIGLADKFADLVRSFIGKTGEVGKADPATDRWAMALRPMMPALSGQADSAMALAELRRQLRRADDARGTKGKDGQPGELEGLVLPNAEAYIQEVERRWSEQKIDRIDMPSDSVRGRKADANWAAAFELFIQLCLSASFMARGRDQ